MSARGHSATWQQVPATSALPPQSRQALTRLARQFRANSDIADLIRSPCRRVPAMPLEPSHPLPPNLLSPLRLDAMSEQWPVQQADALVCINTIHITPWEACKGLMTGAERILRSGGVLYLYGPYQIDGRHTAQSNEEFDAWLRTQNAQWGVRDLAEVTALAQRHAFSLRETVSMPANNLSVIFERGP